MLRKQKIGRLLAAAVALPIVILVVSAFGRLLAALGDTSGGHALDRVGLICGILWVLSLIGLLLVVAARTMRDERLREDECREERHRDDRRESDRQ